MKLVLASKNPHKLAEISDILGPGYTLLSLKDIGCLEDIPEPWNTLEENALAKARYVNSKFGFDCFADDTGLEVPALGGLPGVQSARYAGPGKNSRDNRIKLLNELKHKTHRQARFRTVIALVYRGQEYIFEGIVKGFISIEARGEGGFGYDPIFIPEGYDQTFGELPAEIKNNISHRYRAIEKLVDFLNTSV